MKKYRLLKSLPNTPAGVVFTLTEREVNGKPQEVMLYENESAFFDINRKICIPKKEILDFHEWFEPYDAKYFYHVNYYLSVEREEIRPKGFGLSGPEGRSDLKAVGNYFETEEEAQKHLEWLKARAVLLEDTNGFKPDWNNRDQAKYEVCYNGLLDCIIFNFVHLHCYNSIVFRTEEDVKASIDKHKKEWLIYLGVE